MYAVWLPSKSCTMDFQLFATNNGYVNSITALKKCASNAVAYSHSSGIVLKV